MEVANRVLNNQLVPLLLLLHQFGILTTVLLLTCILTITLTAMVPIVPKLVALPNIINTTITEQDLYDKAPMQLGMVTLQ